MKKCLFCAAEIQDEVIKCKFCGEFVSEKARHAHLTGFWQDLGQRAKKKLDKFETNADNRREQQKTGLLHDLGQRAKRQLDKFENNAPNREKQRKRENVLSWLGCLGFIVLIIVIAILLL